MNKLFNQENIRNIGIVGHTGCGKTMLLEHILYQAKEIDKIGSIDKGTTVSDYDEEEKKRKISLKATYGAIAHNGHKLNIIDTPGSADFTGEVRAAYRVADGLVFVIDAESGVQIETIKQWNLADEYKLPRIVFINKMDKKPNNFKNIANDIKANFQKPAVPVEIPIIEDNSLIGVIDLLDLKAWYKKDNHMEEAEIPDNYKEEVNSAYEHLMETVAEASDEYIEKFLEGEKLTHDEMLDGFLKTVEDSKFIPIICGSNKLHIGIRSLARIAFEAFPCSKFKQGKKGFDEEGNNIEFKRVPSEKLSAFCFKTVIDQFSGKLSYIQVISGSLKKDDEIFISNTGESFKVNKMLVPRGSDYQEISEGRTGDIVILQKIDELKTSHTLCTKDNYIKYPELQFTQSSYSLAISSNDKKNEDKLLNFLHKFSEEDPTLQLEFNPETHENVLSARGELHLDVYFSKIKKLSNIEIITKIPKINYKETIKKESVETYRHKKQSGGHGQFGEVAIKVRPTQNGEKFNFVNSITGGRVPKQYIPGVEKGLLEGMEEGIIAKYPVTGIEVELYDGQYHPVDSSEMAFKIAAKQALKGALKKANSVLLEPVMHLEVYAPEKYVGDIMSDLSSKRGKIIGQDILPGQNILIKADVPHSELLKYAVDLKSLTQGTGSFEISFDHYTSLSGKSAQKIIENRKKELTIEE